MIKKIDGILIMGSLNYFVLNNSENQSYFNFNTESGSACFRDSNGNIIQNHSATIRINFDVFNLRELGQTINLRDGSVIAYLSSNDVMELAEKTFYEEGQTHIYDFINQKFIIDL